MDFTGRWWFMWIIPAAIGVLSGCLFLAYPQANLAHDRGLLDVSAGLLSMLVGFFVAALGLAITIESDALNQVAKDNPPTLKGKGVTWRLFTCGLTAYLVLISLGTYIIAMAALSLQPIASELFDESGPLVRAGVAAVYAFLFAHVVSVTLLTLFLLAVKVPELQKKPKKPRPAANIEGIVLDESSEAEEAAANTGDGKAPPSPSVP